MRHLVTRRFVASLLIALLVAPALATAAAPSDDEGDSGSNDNHHCMQNWLACRRACVTDDTEYFLGGIIDWDTNMCLIDCNLVLANCIAIQMSDLFEL